jgi:hypothetical protein
MAIERQVPQEDSETGGLGRNGKLDGVGRIQRNLTDRRKNSVKR